MKKVRAAAITPDAVQLAVAGSYRSTESTAFGQAPLPPPATSTLPNGSRVASAPSMCGEATALVGIHVSMAGSKISAEAIGSPIGPPTTSTFPEGSSVAVCVRQSRIVVIPAVELHEPVGGS